jgi:DNA polymerase eta
MLERFPYLANVPPDAPNGIDTLLPPPPPILWGNLGYVIPINSVPQSSTSVPNDQKSNETENSIGASSSGQAQFLEGSSNQTDTGTSIEVHEEEDRITTWHDVALSIAAELMQTARQEVLEKLGYSTSAVSIRTDEIVMRLIISILRRGSLAISSWPRSRIHP